MRFLPRTFGALALTALAGVAALTWLACGDDIDMYPPASGCAEDAGCGVSSGGGVFGNDGGTTSTGTGTGGGITVGELTGTIAAFADATFETITPNALTGSAQIVLQPTSGSTITIPYSGSTATTFDQMDVPSGSYWVTVEDESAGANGIWNTITSLQMPQVAAVTFPVVLKSTFANLASNLPSVQSQGVNAASAQVVLLLQYNNAPFSGAQVTAGQNGGVIAYDQGPGTYSDTATTTGSAGTVILFNAGGSETLTIGLASTTLGRTWTVQVYVAPGAVTVAGFDLQ
jgi:hypothetical protein